MGSSGTSPIYPSAFPGLGQCCHLSSSTMDGETVTSSFSRALRIPRYISSLSWRCSPPACIHPTTFPGLWRPCALFSSQGLPSHLGLCLCSFLASFLSLFLSTLVASLLFLQPLPPDWVLEANFCLPLGLLRTVLGISLALSGSCSPFFFFCFLRMTCVPVVVPCLRMTCVPVGAFWFSCLGSASFVWLAVFNSHFGGFFRVPETQRNLHVLHLLGSAQLKGLFLLRPWCTGLCGLGSLVTALACRLRTQGRAPAGLLVTASGGS